MRPGSRRRWSTALALLAIVLLGAYFRTTGLFTWDEPSPRLHPDERFMVMVAERIRLPESLGEYLDSEHSRLNPRNNDFNLYVYGMLPQLLTRMSAVMLTPDSLLPPTINTSSTDQTQVVNPELTYPKLTLLMPVLNPQGLNLTEYGHLHQVGRAWSTLAELGSIVLVFLIGRRLYGRRAGLLAALLFAASALPIQLAHFFTVDALTSFCTLLTLYWCVRIAQGGGPLSFAALGLSIGAAMACRITMATLGLIGLIAVVQRTFLPLPVADSEQEEAETRDLLPGLIWLMVAGVVSVLTFRMLQPDAFIGQGIGAIPPIFDLRPEPRFLANIREVGTMVDGTLDFPPGVQWANREPFLFPLRNMILWGMGVPFGLAALLGWALAGWQIVRRRSHVHLVPWLAVTLYFLWQGGQFVMTMRYYNMLYGVLAVFAGWLITTRHLPEGGLLPQRWPHVPQQWQHIGRAYWLGLRRATPWVVVVGTVLWAFAFTRIYTEPHTRIAASRWIYANIPNTAHITGEVWDDPLPLNIDGRGNNEYPPGLQMQVYAEDDPGKYSGTVDQSGMPNGLLDQLDQADYIILSSNRVYDSIKRIPMRYPALSRYYSALFEGALGFEQVAEFHSYPTLFGIEIPDQSAEEAFSVYDHPRVLIFKKTDAYTRANAENMITRDVVWGEVYKTPSVKIVKAPTALRLIDDQWLLFRSNGTWPLLFDQASVANAVPWLFWLLALEAIGVAAFVLLFRFVPALPDRGWALSKTLGLLVLGYAVWLLASLGRAGAPLMMFGPTSVRLCFAALIAFAALIGWRNRAELWAWLRARRGAVLMGEAVFLAIFGLFLWFRYTNPDLWHPARGGEKPMDLAFLTAILKSPSFPPYDPWFAGGFINYYYFGFVLVATLIHLTGIVPTVAYNLAVPTMAALTALGAWGVGYNLLALRSRHAIIGQTLVRRSGRWLRYERRARVAGVLAALFVVLFGNLVQAVWFLPGTADRDQAVGDQCEAVSTYAAQQMCRGRNEWAFWDATRVVSIALTKQTGENDSTITEIPFFTFLFADLHAHMMALPLATAALGLLVALVRGRQAGDAARLFLRRQRFWVPLALLALVVGALRATNTWDFPTYVGLGVLTAALLAWRDWQRGGSGERALAQIVVAALVLVAGSSLLFAPFLAHFGTDYAGFEVWRGARTGLGELLKLHGLWLFLLGSAGVVFLLNTFVPQYRRARPNHSTARLLPVIWAVAGFGLIAMTEVLVARGDIGRMNTVFKFGMQSWTLLAITSALALVWLWPQRLHSSLLLNYVWRGVALVLMAAALVYPLTATPARLADRFDPDLGPSLDGAAYMLSPKAQWGENNQQFTFAEDAAAMDWMRQNIAGTPIVLEAQTEGYRWGSRVSIYTGLPTLLGWPWHETQQRSVSQVGQVLTNRRDAVQQIYTAADADTALGLIKQYGIEYVYVGQLEQALFGQIPQQLMNTLVGEGRVQQVYAAPNTAIYFVPAAPHVPGVLTHTPPVVAPATPPTKTLLLDQPVDMLAQVNEFAWNSLAQNQIVAVVLWLVFGYLLAGLGLPLAVLVFGRWRDGGWAWARLIGLLLLGYAVWLPVSAHLWVYDRRGLLLGVLVVAVFDLALLGWHGRAERWSPLVGLRQIRSSIAAQRRAAIRSELVFLAAFALFVVIRALNPDLWQPVWGGEKPFEFAFLNAVLRSPTMPPYDPFFSGGYINYYYYGLFLASLPIKAIGVAPAIGFNLAIPLLFALFAVGVFAVVRQITGRSRYAALGVVLVAVCGNLAGAIKIGWSQGLGAVWRVLQNGGIGDLGAQLGDWFIGPSRVIPSTINEFPFWTFLFADLHPHLIALPITVLAAALAFALIDQHDPEKAMHWWPTLGLAALTLGTLAVTNSWDFPTYTLLIGLALVGAAWRRGGHMPMRALAARLVAAAILAVGVAAVALVLFLPFFQHFAAQVGGIAPVTTNATELPFYLAVYGMFVGLVLPTLLLMLWRSTRPTTRPAGEPSAAFGFRAPLLASAARRSSLSWLWMFVAGIGVALLLVGWQAPAVGLKLWLGALLFLGAALLGDRNLPDRVWYLVLLATLAWAVSLGMELVVVRDHLFGGDWYRMNTVFKFGTQVWVLLGLAAAVAVPELMQVIRTSLAGRGPKRIAGAVLMVVLLGVFSLTLVFPIFGVPSRVAYRFPQHPGPTLDGLAFMRQGVYSIEGRDIDLQYDAEAIDWLNRTIQGTPVVIQTSFEFYRAYGVRVAANTGLPTVLSSLHENEQRDPQQTQQRENDVREFFSTPDVNRTLELLMKYRIGYVYIGPVEQAVYDPVGLAKFEQMNGSYLSEVFRNDGVTIYAVNPDISRSVVSLQPQQPAAEQPAPAQDTPDLLALEEQVKANPNVAGTAFALAQQYFGLGRLEEAAKVLDVATKSNPNDVPMHHLYGDILRDSGRYDEAEEAYRHAVSIDPSAGNYNKLGAELFKMGRLDKAEQALNEALVRDAGLPEAYFYLGGVYASRGENDKARQNYQQFLQLAPADHYLRGQATTAIDSLK